MQTVPSLVPAIRDPLSVLAHSIAEGHALLAWAVEFAGDVDPIPDAWRLSRDPVAMSVLLASSAPQTFLSAMKSIPSARYPNAIGDTLQVLAFLPDAVRARMLGAVVRDATRMVARLSSMHRELLTTSVCSALRMASPVLTFDVVVDSARRRAT